MSAWCAIYLSGYTQIKPLRNNWRVKVESAMWIILSLEIPKLLQTPRLMPVHLLHRLHARRVVDVRVHLLPPARLMQYFPETRAQLNRFPLHLRPGGGVLYLGRDDQIVCPERVRRRLAADRSHALHGVALEKETGGVERGRLASRGGKEIVYLTLTRWAVDLEVERDVHLDLLGFLARRALCGYADP